MFQQTHDYSVPDEVFQLLEFAISKCLNLKYVVLEQLGTGLETAESRDLFQQDFLRMQTIVQNENNRRGETKLNSFLPSASFPHTVPLQDKLLYQQQLELSAILETATSCEHAKQLLNLSGLANTDWQAEKWEDYMLETAVSIAKKWKNGFK